jgi:hypothetical protein
LKLLTVYLPDGVTVKVNCARVDKKSVWLIATGSNGIVVGEFRTNDTRGYTVEDAPGVDAPDPTHFTHTVNVEAQAQ